MSEKMRVRVGQEMDAETVVEIEDGLVEVGAVSETKGGVIGVAFDTAGNGGYYV